MRPRPICICLTQLAFFTGQPRLAPVLARQLAHDRGDHRTLDTWSDAVSERLPAEMSPEARASFLAALRLIPDAEKIALQSFRDWLPETTRYLFHRDE